MKKIIALLLVLMMAVSLVACQETTPSNTTTKPTTTNPTTQAKPTEPDPTEPGQSETVMTHAEYMAAEDGMAVIVEFYVQATQGWWFDSSVGHGKITIYGQTTEGGYYAYEVNCTEEDADKLAAGTKIRVSGEKATWEGEVEIVNGTMEIIEDDAWLAEPQDVTALLGTEDLVKHQNERVSFKNVTVAASTIEGDTNEYAFLYKWNGSGADGDDLYFNVTVGDATYTFCVESYLCGAGSDVYEAVKALKIGDVIDLEGFLYWYNGAQPHITVVTPVA